jgi:hypothetical protein
MVPTLDEASAWPAAMVVAGAAVFATPLPCLLGASAAAMAALAGPGLEMEAPLAKTLAGMSLAAGAASLDSEAAARLRSGLDPAWPAAVAGLGFCLGLAALGGGQGLTLRGADLVAGTTLLVTLAGALALLAHLLTPAVPSAPVRRSGQKLVVLGGGLAVVTVGYALHRGQQAPERLAAGASDLAGVLLGAGALVGSLVVLLGGPAAGEPAPLLRRSATEARLGAALAMAAAGAAGLEAFYRGGSYTAPLTAAAAAAALLGLAVLEPTRLSLTRKALLMLALAFMMVKA